MTFKVKSKKKTKKGSFKVYKKKKTYKEDDVVDEVYNMGDDIVEGANPFFMTGRALGYDDETQEKIYKKKAKVSSPHLKAMGQKDISM